MIDFTKYKENLSVEAFVSIVSRDIIKNMDDDTRGIFLWELLYLTERRCFYWKECFFQGKCGPCGGVHAGECFPWIC